jgi:hypothetical protein
VIKDTEDSNEAIAKRRDGGDSTGVCGRGMLSKGLCRDLGEPMSSLINRRDSSILICGFMGAR